MCDVNYTWYTLISRNNRKRFSECAFKHVVYRSIFILHIVSVKKYSNRKPFLIWEARALGWNKKISFKPKVSNNWENVCYRPYMLYVIFNLLRIMVRGEAKHFKYINFDIIIRITIRDKCLHKKKTKIELKKLFICMVWIAVIKLKTMKIHKH